MLHDPDRKAKLKGAAAMSEYLNETIGYKLEGTAEWRRRKAEQFPDDSRNVEAAEELERLAREVDALGKDSEIEEQIRDAEERINRLEKWDALAKIEDAVSTELRSIGFHGSYGTATELLTWYRDLLSEKLRELIEEADDELEGLELEAVPVPDLRGQVENDPSVKAARSAFDQAKLAYEDAYNKAMAEARKTI
jgi:hypothetical protein